MGMGVSLATKGMISLAAGIGGVPGVDISGGDSVAMGERPKRKGILRVVSVRQEDEVASITVKGVKENGDIP